MVATLLKFSRLAWQFPLMLALVASPAGAAAIPEQDCVIEPHTVVDLASAVEGIVESLEVARGDLVERDQVLVRLDAGVERAAVDYARARAAASAQVRAGEANAGFAQRRAGRVGVLYEQKVVSSDQMDEAATQTKLTRAQAEQAAENQRLAHLELRQAQENLARHIIRSPIRGVVVQDYLSPGESVKDKPILRLAEIDPLRVEVIVPVAYFGAIVPGQSATVHPEAPREGNFQAKVSIVDRVADAASGTFRVRLSLPNADFALPSGLKCRVEFGPAPPAPAVKAAAPAAKPAARPRVEPSATPAPSAAPAPVSPAALPGDTIAGVRPASSYPGNRRLAKAISPPVPVVAPQHVAASPSAVASPAGERPASSYPASRRLAKTISRPAPLLAAQPAAADRRVAASRPAVVIRSDIPAAPSCRTLGPIESADRADQIRALLAGKVGRLEIRAAGNDSAPGYMILTPPQATPEDARLLAAKMRKAGIEDLHVYPSGSKRNRIALGMYASQKRAQARRDALATLGFEAAVLPGTQPDKSLWLDMQVGTTPAALESLKRSVAALAPGLTLAAVPCNELVAARR